MSYFLAFCLALCWGTAFLATKNIVTALPPYWSTFFRVLAGLVFFLILYTIQKKSLKIDLKQIWRPFVIGFLLILFPFAALSWGQRFVAPTVGGIFNGTVPIWSFIAGAIILKGVDRFTWRRAAGIIFGIIGLLIITWPKLSANFHGINSAEIYGYIALLFMAWSYGLGNVMTKKIMVDNNKTTLEANTFYQYLISAVILLVISYLAEPFPSVKSFSAKVIISIICAGVFSSAIAFLLMVALIKRWGATRMASVTYFTPVIAMVLDIFALRRYPTSYELIGLCIIFAGLFLIQKPIKE
ncbi:MAG: DMT family transporter [Elusimicrobiaceae bacterium]|nr:DMT family transporter [Elusimicrobiaceae bacterium]